MIKIYHNPRCKKSREGLAILENSGKDFEVIKYLEDIPTKKELTYLLKILGIKPIDLVRKNEAIWKEKFKNKTLTDDNIIEALLNHPKLIERPIVIKDSEGVIGRPASNINRLID